MFKAGQEVTVKFECTDRIERSATVLSTDRHGTLELLFTDGDVAYFDSWEVYAK